MGDYFFSVIVPCKKIDEYTQRCVRWLGYQVYNKLEVIVVSDVECPGFPAVKRNWALKKAKGNVIAYIDSDAYPSVDWLKNACEALDRGYVAVCGPGVLPGNAPLMEQTADGVLRLLPFSYRIVPKKERVVAEFPTFNLIVLRSAVERVGGFQEHLLTGEDTMLCRSLAPLGKILYSPDIVVYHNRRELFKPYIRQISTYGYHRGWLIKQVIFGLLVTAAYYTGYFILGMFGKMRRRN